MNLNSSYNKILKENLPKGHKVISIAHTSEQRKQKNCRAASELEVIYELNGEKYRTYLTANFSRHYK